MIKAVVIHQPNFLPRLKVFIKIAISDIWVIYDDVQYVRREWQNRVYLRDSQQKEKLFTAPIKKTDFHDRINNVQLSNVTILNENLRKYFRYNYSQSPYYKWIEEYIEKLMIQTNNINNLSNYNIICTNIALDMLGLEVEELLSSKIEKLNIDRNKKLIEICNKSNSKAIVLIIFADQADERILTKLNLIIQILMLFIMTIQRFLKQIFIT